MTIHLNLGSNKGDRYAFIGQAVALIINRLQCSEQEVRVSQPIETEAWGYSSANYFVNVGMMLTLQSHVDPFWLLENLKEIEKEIAPEEYHRDIDGKYSDRSIDIDIIAIDDLIIDSEKLTVPHPYMHLREFVLRPLCELDPKWYHPILGKTGEALLEAIS